MEFITDYGLFLAKAVTIVLAIAIVVAIANEVSGKGKKGDKGHLEVLPLNEFVKDMREVVQESILTDDQKKALKKKEKSEEKAKAKQEKSKKESSQKGDSAEPEAKKRLFVLNFKGDTHASAVAQLRESITAVLEEATSTDEVVVRLESPGGAVHSYGLAASQLDRVRNKKIPLTICVDEVAASGGYMMACVGDKILSAPFAMVGSIGVLAQMPNFHRLLKKHDVDFEEHTAGEFKRTLTMLGENTDANREKLKEELEEIHNHFKSFIAERRPNLDIDKVSTGEVWLGSRAKELGLVDEIMTSDEYLTTQMADADLFEINFVQKKPIAERLGIAAEGSADRLVTRWVQRLSGKRYIS